MSEGLAWPSVGSQEAPTRSPVSISGHIAFTSAGEISCMSMPKLLAVVASRGIRSSGRLVGGEPQATGHLPAGRKPGFGLEPLVEIDRIFEHAGDRGRRAQLPDQPGRMPGRARGQLALFEQHHVRLVVARQVIGGRAADDAAADDDDLGVGGQASCRRLSVGGPVGSSAASKPRQVFAGVGRIVDAGRVEVAVPRPCSTSPRAAARRIAWRHASGGARRVGAFAEIGGEEGVRIRRSTCRRWRPRRQDRTSPSRSRHIRNRSATAGRRRRGSWPATDRCGRR